MATELFIPNRTQEMGVRSVDRRIHLRLRISTQLSGMDLAGQDFVEEGNTILVAPSGAIIECNRALGPDQEVALRVGKKEALARVLGQAGLSESKYVYGVSFMQPDVSFWGVSFPSSESTGAATSAALIECGRCGIQRTYALNEIEALVISASRSFGLYCSGCKDSTLWKRAAASSDVPALREWQPKPVVMKFESTSAPNELIPLAGSLENRVRSEPRENQRKHRRIAMSRSKACVHRPNAEEETVDLVDVSRGGAAFRSDKIYSLGCWVRIAAPCTVGAANIFVLARVVRVVRTETGREYGVEYVETSN